MAVVVHLVDDGGGVVTVLNNGIVVQPEDAKVGARLCTIVNVDLIDREEELELLVAVKGELHAEHVEEVWDTFRRDGRLAGIGEGLGVIAPLAVEKQQHAGADTNKFSVCVAQIRDVDAALLLLKRDLVG